MSNNRGKHVDARPRQAASSRTPSGRTRASARTNARANAHTNTYTNTRANAFPFVALAAIAIFVVLVGVGFVSLVIANDSQADEEAVVETETTEATVVASSEEVTVADDTESSAETTDFSPTVAALDGVPSSTSVESFSLSDLAAADIPADQLAAIEQAIAAASVQGDVSFIMYDLESGRGISYNADGVVYGASSIKAPFVLYMCETLIETGELALSDSVSSYLSRGTVSELIETTIVDSNNNAYGALRTTYENISYDSWATALGATDTLCRSDSWYAWYCARSSAKLWTEMYTYLQSGTETSVWLGELLGSTTTSFIRNAITGTGATVQDKAGWCSDFDSTYNSICDAGIIELDGHTYILSLMTGMADSDANETLYENLAAAVFAAHESLNLVEDEI